MTITEARIGRERIREPIDCSRGGRTKQSFKDECDVNQIMKQWETTGQVVHLNRMEGTYGDFTGIATYQEAQNQVKEAEQAFSELPARIRARFRNDPNELLTFINNPDNTEEAIKLGLAVAPEAIPVPTPPDPENPPAPAGTPPEGSPSPPAGEASND